MECLAGGGEAGTAANRRRRPAGSGGRRREIDELRGSPACAARLRRTSREWGSRGAARQGAGETVAPAASSARRQLGFQPVEEQRERKQREGEVREMEGGSTARRSLSARGGGGRRWHRGDEALPRTPLPSGRGRRKVGKRKRGFSITP